MNLSETIDSWLFSLGDKWATLADANVWVSLILRLYDTLMSIFIDFATLRLVNVRFLSIS